MHDITIVYFRGVGIFHHAQNYLKKRRKYLSFSKWIPTIVLCVPEKKQTDAMDCSVVSAIYSNTYCAISVSLEDTFKVN